MDYELSTLAPHILGHAIQADSPCADAGSTNTLSQRELNRNPVIGDARAKLWVALKGGPYAYPAVCHCAYESPALFKLVELDEPIRTDGRFGVLYGIECQLREYLAHQWMNVRGTQARFAKRIESVVRQFFHLGLGVEQRQRQDYLGPTLIRDSAVIHLDARCLKHTQQPYGLEVDADAEVVGNEQATRAASARCEQRIDGAPQDGRRTNELAGTHVDI